MTESRRKDDEESFAHKRGDDDFARLHRRIDDQDRLLNELIKAKFEAIRLHNETTDSIKALTDAVRDLAIGTQKLRDLEGDVSGMLRMLSRMNGFIGLLWKPILFVAIAGGTFYLWVKGLAK